MSLENPSREHIGGGEPYEKLQKESRDVAQRAAKVEEELQEAKQAEDKPEVERLEKEHKDLMRRQQETGEKAAELRAHKLRE